MKKTSLFSKVIPFTVNGVARTAPFTDAFGTQIVINGGQLVLGTVFGLTVAWNGISKVEETLCDAYSTFVCGLCGNGDGIERFSLKIQKKKLNFNKFLNKGFPANYFVDRNNQTVTLVGAKYTKYFEWGSSWRVYDDAADADQAL